MINDSQIEQYINIYCKKFGTEINKEDANKQGVKLVNLFKVVIDYLYGTENTNLSKCHSNIIVKFLFIFNKCYMHKMIKLDKIKLLLKKRLYKRYKFQVF